MEKKHFKTFLLFAIEITVLSVFDEKNTLETLARG